VNRIKNSENARQKYQYYTNDDYHKFEPVDLRTLRHKSKDNLGGEDLTDLNFDRAEEEPSEKPSKR
jgi:hypothetical protein